MSTRHIGKTKARARRVARQSRGRRDGSMEVFDGVLRELLASQARDVLRERDPLGAEMWASEVLGMFGRHPLVGERDSAAAIGGRLVAVARRSRTPAALMCVRAVAAVSQGGLRDRARAAVREMGAAGSGPAWLEAIGTAAATAAWRATDLCGDQDSVMVGFRYPGGAEHSILVLVDHVLGGIAKDVAVLGSLDEVVALWRGTSDVELVEEPVEVAAGRVAEAVAWTSRTIDAPVTDDYRDGEALVRARLAPLAAHAPTVEPPTDDEREALVQAFLADAAGARFADDPRAWFLLDVLVDYRCDYHGRDPLRWSPGAALTFLLDFVPRKITSDQENLRRFPDVLRAWVPWAGHRAGLPARLADETIEAIDDAESDLVDAIGDEDRWGPAKRLAMGMLADGIDPSDVDAANDWLAAQTA